MRSKTVFFLSVITSCLIFFNALNCPAQEETKNHWLVKKGTHFIIYYAPDFKLSRVEQLLREAENYYSQITEDLGFRRFNFWTWDNRCKIYLYDTAEHYYNSTQQPQWSRASVHIKDRVIHAFSIETYFFNTILPHEMGHLIFREFAGYTTPLPLWLDEGIATFVEKDKGVRLDKAKEIIKSLAFIPLPQLTELNISNMTDPDTFYAEASSIVEFLLKKYGGKKFMEYCRLLRDKGNWYDGLRGIYGFSDLYDMNDKWMEFLLE